MASVFTKIYNTINKHPVLRGMISYSIIWPVSNICQQTFMGRRFENYDWGEVLRFSIFGGFYVAPTLYSWVRIAGLMWPKSNLKTAIIKALVEQISYTPFAMTSFFFGMSLMELKTIEEAFNEVKTKVFPTYKVAICVWPILATINFGLVPERNRVPFISVCSLIWTCFLAYMKHLQAKELELKKEIGLIRL